MKRLANPALSPPGEFALRQYEQVLREQEDLTPASVRNDLSDVCQFIAWYETQAEIAARHDLTFTPQSIATPTLARYRPYLQTIQRHKPASVNRSLISLKRYFEGAKQNKLIVYDLSAAVTLVGQEVSAPRHLDDDQKQALVCGWSVASLQGCRSSAMLENGLTMPKRGRALGKPGKVLHVCRGQTVLLTWAVYHQEASWSSCAGGIGRRRPLDGASFFFGLVHLCLCSPKN